MGKKKNKSQGQGEKQRPQPPAAEQKPETSDGKKDEKESKTKEEECGGEKADKGPAFVVVKVDMHCDGCANKIRKSVRGFQGVEGVVVDPASGRLTVIGPVDHVKLKNRIESRTRKSVEILNPQAKKEKYKDKDSDPKKDEGSKNPNAGEKKPQKAADENKPKLPAVSTVVLKFPTYCKCEGCHQKIRKTIMKIKGVDNVAVDGERGMVTATGTMDPKTLPSTVKAKLRKNVEVVPAKKECGDGEKRKETEMEKEKEKEKEKGKEKGKEKEKEKEKKQKENCGEKKEKKEGENEAAVATATAAAAVAEANRMEYCGGYAYRCELVHAPQYFSDENPNACSVM